MDRLFEREGDEEVIEGGTKLGDMREREIEDFER